MAQEFNLDNYLKDKEIIPKEKQVLFDLSKYLTKEKEEEKDISQLPQSQIYQPKEKENPIKSLFSSAITSFEYGFNDIASKLAWGLKFEPSAIGDLYNLVDNVFQKAGIDKIEDIFEITKGEQYKKLEENAKKNYLMSAIGEVVGGLPAGIAEWIGNVPWALYAEFVEQVKAKGKPTDVIKFTLASGLKRFILGRLFGGLDKLPAIKKALGAGAIGFTDYTSEVAMHTELDENFIGKFTENFDEKEAIKSTLSLTMLNIAGQYQAKRKAKKMENLVNEIIQEKLSKMPEREKVGEQKIVEEITEEAINSLKQELDNNFKPIEEKLSFEKEQIMKELKEIEFKPEAENFYKAVEKEKKEKTPVMLKQQEMEFANLMEKQQKKEEVKYEGDDISLFIIKNEKPEKPNKLFGTIYDKIKKMRDERQYRLYITEKLKKEFQVENRNEIIDKLTELVEPEKYEQFTQKYGISPENMIKVIREDISGIKKAISFPETLAKKYPESFGKLFNNAVNMFNESVAIVNDVVLKFDLQNVYRILHESKYLQEYMKDIKTGITKIKWSDINYLKEKGFTDKEIEYITRLLKDKREDIYLILKADKEKLKLQPEERSALNKLEKLYNENKEFFDKEDAFLNEEIMKNFGNLNENEIWAMKKIKEMNNYIFNKIYQDMIENWDYIVNRRAKEGKAINYINYLSQKREIVNEFIELYDKYYYNKVKKGSEYIVRATGRDAKPIIFYEENLSSAKKRIMQLKDMGWEAELIKNIEEIRNDYLLPADMMSNYNKILPSEVKEIFDAKERNVEGFWSHLMHAFHFPSDSINISENMAKYISQFSNFISRRKYKTLSKEILDKYQTHPAFKGTNIFNAMEKYYNDIFYPKSSVMSKITGYLGAYYLWGNMKSALLQFTQPFLATYPYLTKYTSYPKAAKYLSKGYEDTMKYIFKKEKLEKENPELYNDIQRALKETTALDEQWLNFLMEESMTKGFLDTIINKGLMPFGHADKLQRLISFIAGWHMAKGEKLPAFEKALEIAEETNFNYTKANRPELARSALAPIFALRMFEGHQFRLMKEYMKEKEWKAFTGQMATYAVLGGLRGFPFAITITALLSSMGVNIEKEFLEKAGKGMENLYFALLRGLPTLMGVDISGSVSFGRMIPAFDANFEENFYRNILGVPANILQRGTYATRKYLKGKFGEGFATTFPVAIGNLILAKMNYDKGLYFEKKIKGLGTYKQYIMKPSDLYSAILKSLGFNPKKYSIYWIIKNLERYFSEKELRKIKIMFKEK